MSKFPKVRDHLVQGAIMQLRAGDYGEQAVFTRRITALAWHQKYPYRLASASKFGDIQFISGSPNEGASRPNEPPLNFTTKAEINGVSEQEALLNQIV